MKTIPAKWRIRRSPPQGWPPSRPAMKNYMHIWNKPSPELSKTYNETRNSLNRSPRAIKTIQALEAAIAMFDGNNQDPEYQISDYATGNKHWRRAPSVHPVPITDLLTYDIQKQHNKNKILGDKVAQVLQQNTNFSDEISKAYQTPSEKLKKDPIMALVTKTVATFMFIRHNNENKKDPKTMDFSSWAEPFFKKKE
jgi:hypothetical protein